MDNQINSDDLWSIINGKCTLPEAMKYMGVSDENINSQMNNIKENDVNDSFSYSGFCHLVKVSAYLKLIELNQVDVSKIFNFGSHSFDDNPRNGDIGMRGNKTYVFKDEWKLMY